jgi:hypothetical protein
LLVLIALGFTLAGILIAGFHSPVTTVKRLLACLLGLIVAEELVGMTVHGLAQGQLTRQTPMLPFYAGLIVLAFLVLSYAWATVPLAHCRFPAILVMYALMGAWIIQAVPNPSIDVWYLQQEACQLLLDGKNPYTAEYDYPLAKNTPYFYGPDVLKNGRIQSFPYPPLSLLLSLPGYALMGDVRWSMLIAMLGTAAFLVATGRRLGLVPGHWVELATVALLCHPRGLTVLEAAWTEPFVGLAASFCTYVFLGNRSWLWGLALGLFLSVKQYGVLWIPSFYMAGCLRKHVIGIAMGIIATVIVPFYISSPSGLWRGTIAFQINQPFRNDALSVLALVARSTGIQLPSLVGFGAAAVVVVSVLWFSSKKLTKIPITGAATFLAFFVFNKQAFLNYYWFVSVLLAQAIIVSVAEDEKRCRYEHFLGTADGR